MNPDLNSQLEANVDHDDRQLSDSEDGVSVDGNEIIGDSDSDIDVHPPLSQPLGPESGMIENLHPYPGSPVQVPVLVQPEQAEQPMEPLSPTALELPHGVLSRHRSTVEDPPVKSLESASDQRQLTADPEDSHVEPRPAHGQQIPAVILFAIIIIILVVCCRRPYSRSGRK